MAFRVGEKVTTDKRQFVHVRRADGNTICGAHPHYYGPNHLVRLSNAEARKMHHCKRCFPEGPPTYHAEEPHE